MICIMLNRFYEISEKWLFDRLYNNIKATDKITIVPFAFRECQIADNNDWQMFYGENGQYIADIIKSFEPYGIPSDNFQIVNYFIDSTESAKCKISNADILYFTGGLPDKMMKRLEEFDLIDLIKLHKGLAVGFSAGAMIMLDRFHITPDSDYPEFTYKNGLGLVNGVDIEVHFKKMPEQLRSIERTITETKLPVYAISDGGALIIKNNEISQAGNTCVYSL